MKRIPISAAERVAKDYGYDQVIVYARKVDRPAGVGETACVEVQGGEHMTTYGVNKAHCDAAAKIGNFLKYKIMGWVKENEK